MKKILGMAALLAVVAGPVWADDPQTPGKTSETRHLQQRVTDLRARLQQFMDRGQKDGVANPVSGPIMPPATTAEAHAKSAAPLVAPASPPSSDKLSGDVTYKELSDDGKATMVLLYQDAGDKAGASANAKDGGTGSASKAIENLRMALRAPKPHQP